MAKKSEDGFLQKIIDGFRAALRDTLVPEIKELQTGQERVEREVAGLRAEMRERLARIEERLDLMPRVARLEADVDNLKKKAAS